jgi:sulfur carrier protein
MLADRTGAPSTNDGTLKRPGTAPATMEVAVEVVGEDTHTVDASDETTYAELVDAVGYNVNEVSVLVDGTPVPEDQPVDADHVTVLRLIRGG